MEEGVGTTRYWCHRCKQTVNPLREAELKCPLCQGGFLEQMASRTARVEEPGLASNHALSLWGPILLRMVGNTLNRQISRRRLLDDHNNHSEDHGNGERQPSQGETRSSSAFLQLLQGIHAGIEQQREREREQVILINPFNQTIVVQGSGNSNQGSGNSNQQGQSQSPFGSIGDFFIGHALDLLMQHLAENDPNRHGTLPAKREAVDALSTVKIEDDLQCPICLDEFEICGEAKEMPCKHKFHGGCILPWLELHSTCPVCRFELPWPLNVFSPSSSSGHGAATSQADGN